MGIEKGPPIWDDSATVEDFLRDDLNQSRGFWRLMAEPLLYSCAFLLVSIISAFFIREELTAEWRGFWTAIGVALAGRFSHRPAGLSGRDHDQDRPPMGTPKVDWKAVVETRQSHAPNEPLYRC